MNERFENEFRYWVDGNISPNGFIDSHKLAKHFYNLALDSVKEECQSSMEIYKRDNPAAMRLAINKCLDIISFTERQKA